MMLIYNKPYKKQRQIEKIQCKDHRTLIKLMLENEVLHLMVLRIVQSSLVFFEIQASLIFFIKKSIFYLCIILSIHEFLFKQIILQLKLFYFV